MEQNGGEQGEAPGKTQRYRSPVQPLLHMASAPCARKYEVAPMPGSSPRADRGNMTARGPHDEPNSFPLD